MPQCKKENTVPIVYGFIDDINPEMGKDEGGYEAGGCVVTDSDPDYSCTDCDHK